MTKAELIDIVAENNEGVSKAQIGKIYDSVFETIVRALEVDGKYAVGGFGSFEVKQQAAREGRNPSTKEVIQIPARKAVKFKPATSLKEAMNK